MPQFKDHRALPWEIHSTGLHPSVIHGLDPRSRILVAFLFAATIVYCDQLLALTIGLAIAIAFVVVAKLNQNHILRRVLALNLFLSLMLVMLPFSLAGTPLFSIAGWHASVEGMLRAFEIGLKANAVVLTLLALVSTMDSSLFGHALARLNVPKKLVHLLLFTVRYLEVINREYDRMRKAMKARAFVFRSNPHTWRCIGYLLGMLLVKSMDRSERVIEAMKCRGYTGKLYLINDMMMTRKDHLFLGFNLILLATMITINQL